MSTPDATLAPADREVDARGLNCPLPILRTKKALNDMESGQTIRVLATDPKAPGDFELYCRESGHRLLERGQEGGDFVLVIERAG